ncbi:hypothetical protein A0H81_05854 [Grifola frondosa]|uniref:Uncharacterized protein n=1 Tax=Grifola frondosa TaxID=5627 RepID=A0A1C7MGR3_GRIFR|nr:hypothetical protein A0H81_05854 [Grifola frondosa]
MTPPTPTRGAHATGSSPSPNCSPYSHGAQSIRSHDFSSSISQDATQYIQDPHNFGDLAFDHFELGLNTFNTSLGASLPPIDLPGPLLHSPFNTTGTGAPSTPVDWANNFDATLSSINDSQPHTSVLFGGNYPPFQDDFSVQTFSSWSGPYDVRNSRQIPQIHIDTSETTRMTTPYELPRSPFDNRSPTGFGGQLVYSSPSSGGSVPPITPETSPESLAMPRMPFVNQSPLTPVSPSFSPSVARTSDQQLIMYDVRRDGGLRSVPELAVAYSSPHDGELVPQKPYRPHTQSDRRRYVEEVQLEEPIMFFMQSPDGCGISLRDALNSKFMHLVGRDDLMFEGRGPSVSIRLMWPGYAQWSRQIPTRDFRSPPGPITRSKLAKNVAKTIQRFISDMQNRPMEDDAEARWRVGPAFIKLDDLILVGLQHVSMGSWQAHWNQRPDIGYTSSFGTLGLLSFLLVHNSDLRRSLGA